MNNENKLTKNFIIGTFVTLYIMVSVISTIHVIAFFELSNPKWLAITLALAFEVGAAASLASIIALKKMNKSIVWMLFFILTAMQAMGNAYFAYVNLKDYKEWIELFGLIDYEPIFQKRILSIVSGAILPLVALGFIKSLVDYIRPEEMVSEPVKSEDEKLFDGEESLINLSYPEKEEEIEPAVVGEEVIEEEYVEEIEPTVSEENIPEIQEEIVVEESIPTVHSTLAPDKEPWDLRPIEEEQVSEDLVSQKPIEVIVDNKEIYPVYDELNKEKNPVIDNIMVFNKDGN